ncbi:FecR family protein [Spirosoma soli]|uniref:FecR family protein n=1 Tax=Spirosoma soli TaxID=1770529 RepID=A0ABW5M8H1_9BACT
MESEVNKNLVFAYFARKTSPLQRALIEQWVQQKPNEELYYEWLEEWENKHPQYVAQSESAYRKYSAYLHENPNQDGQANAPQLRVDRNHWVVRQWFVAASILLVLGGLSAALFRNVIFYRTYETAFGESRTLQLPDKSTVILNANSKLRIPRWGFGKQSREVILTGEASFSVTHMPGNQRFVVKTRKNFDVVVLGTEFTVSARNRGARVALNRGKVELHYQEGNRARQLTMKPGQLATLDRANHVALNAIKHAPVQPAEAGKRFVFDETPLQEVAYMLEDNYGLQVEIKDQKLAERVLMGSLRAENVDQLLQSISELLDIDVVRQGNRVQLKSH